MNIYTSVTQLVGKTPLMELCSYEKEYGVEAKLLAKLEYFNPCGSVKDRVGLFMLRQAVERGDIKDGATIIEPTSGNTGIAIAAMATAMGFRSIIVMPDTMSMERRQLLKAYGAELVLTEGAKGMTGAVEKAKELHEQIENSFVPSQFDNPDNALAHVESTGRELWYDTEGNIDIFVAGVGTGGTLTGNSAFLKSMKPTIKAVAVEPASSPLLSEGRAGSHGLQGIGANFVPKVLSTDLIDEIVCVTEEQAYETCRRLVKTEGLLCGITSGAAVYASTVLAQREENKGKSIAVVLPDSGERYLSTGIFG